MRKIIFLSIFFAFPFYASSAEKPRMVKITELENLLSSRNDTLYVINFWATWCAPCVKELPYFEEAKNAFAGEKVRILLVNLDFKKEYESRLLPFLKKNNLKNEIWFLDETDPNKWIDKISTQWSGAIPFTIMYNAKTGTKTPYETSLQKHELTEKINLNLKL